MKRLIVLAIVIGSVIGAVILGACILMDAVDRRGWA